MSVLSTIWVLFPVVDNECFLNKKVSSLATIAEDGEKNAIPSQRL